MIPLDNKIDVTECLTPHRPNIKAFLRAVPRAWPSQKLSQNYVLQTFIYQKSLYFYQLYNIIIYQFI